ncbi:Transcription factor vib-1 [Tolypocladium capitatum]|uniref:Transcription factor vib-1 n=1 Tax=Tolypocladium capitatum TaxID=45235 RepID=A0A2K3QI29_9HYPO|nr:Transcription factor vib-1 [Tolypocladium capitatum]
MMTTAAYPATMTELRGEPAHSSIWPNYGGSTHLPSRLGGVMDSPFHASSAPHAARPRSHATMDHQPAYPYRGYSQEEPSTYDRPPSYSNLKRPYSQAEPPAYQEIVQDLRDDGSRLTVNQDHKLLAFKRAQDKSTILDQHGRVQQMDLSAQLHGMFFLSEMPSNTTDGAAVQPELTCYRRNLFQVSGSLVMPRGQLSVVNEANETLPVTSMEVAISAIESVDGNPVRLIVIPWKTPPPNSSEVSQGPDQEPPTLPLIPFQDDGADAQGELAVYPIGWRRLQFRIATANNGRRKELQQHFVLHLKVHGTLADNSKVVLSESTTAPIVVRGRSPRNFQARKEIPLLGSSAGSRGQALVETGMGVVASALGIKHDPKVRSIDMQVPRSSFTFSPPKPQGTTLGSMRSSAYPTWNSQVPTSSPGPYPSTSIGGDSYSKLPLSGAPGFSSEPQELPLQTSMAPSVPLPLTASEQSQPSLRSQYSYTTSAPQLSGGNVTIGGGDNAFGMPRYIDGNPRPSKSPRQSGHHSVHSSGSITNTDASSDYRYGSYRASNTGASDSSQAPSYTSESSAATSAPSRDYYPSSNSWTTSAAEPSPSLAYAGTDARSYTFSQEPYKGASSAIPPLKHEYSGAPRSTFVDTISNYSWSAA